MKLSFSLHSKQSSKRNAKGSGGFTNEEPRKQVSTTAQEFLTEFESTSEVKTNHARSNQHLVIPPKQNDWRPHKKMKNLDLPPIRRSSTEGQELQFEVESSDAAANSASQDPGSNMSYGLNVRKSTKDGSDGSSSGDRLRGDPVESALLKKLKEDLHSLPEDEGFDQFDEVPVDGFGAALLAGYGWREGRGIGRNAKEDVKAVEYKRRAGKEGLGYFNDPKPSGDKANGDISERTDKVDSGFSIGKEVRIIRGRHMGLKGKVENVSPGGDLLIVKLSSREELKLHVSDITELGSAEEEKCLKKLKELKIRQSSKDDSRKGDRKVKESSEHGTGIREDRKRGGTDDARHSNNGVNMVSRTKVTWLRSHIRVRIVSKNFKGGRLYLKKGEVIDVVGPTTCDISMGDTGELIQGVDQDILETALPRRGGPVLVLFGKHKGAYGSLVEKNSEKETGVVQDADTREFLNVRLEQIAEYIGDPSYIGY